MAGTAAERSRPYSDDVLRKIEHHMIQVNLPGEFTIDRLGLSLELANRIHIPFVPLAPKHLWGNDRLPVDPRAQKVLEKLQNQWGTGADSFPAMIFVPRGTQEFSIRWAMVRPDDFTKTPDKLLEEIVDARKHRPAPDDEWARSLEFVYTAVTGEPPPGSSLPVPLKEMSRVSKF